jgi:hypothetical protein
MQKFNEGDEVRVIGLEATETLCDIDVDMAVGYVGEIEEAYGSESDTRYMLDNGFWYAHEDLELTKAPVEESVEARTELTTEDVQEGDEVRVMSLKDTIVELGKPGSVEVGDTFVITKIDHDDTVYCDGYGWFLLSDLELVEDEDVAEVERDINFLFTKDSITLMIDGDTEVATKDHKNFTAIRDHVLNEEYDEAMALMNVAVGIQNWGQGSLKIENGKVVYVGMELTGKLVDRIIEMMVGGDNAFEKFAKFLNLTMEQESFKTRSRLMDFAAHDKLDIDDNGYVVAFKNVKADYFDKRSGTFRNMVGDSPSMRRSDVDDNHDHQCSNGLHVCSPTYLKGFWGTSGRTMRVVVDPRDFVAIPYDYNDSKARVCRYSVVEDVTDNIQDYL